MSGAHRVATFCPSDNASFGRHVTDASDASPNCNGHVPNEWAPDVLGQDLRHTSTSIASWVSGSIIPQTLLL